MVYFRLITDLSHAQQVWTELSPMEYIDDDWQYRYCFYRYFRYPLHFVTAWWNDDVVGLLPLQYNTDQGYLEFFGGSYMEDNRIFFRKGFETSIAEFFSQINRPALLEYLHIPSVVDERMQFHDWVYELPLDTLHTYRDYIESYWSGRRKQQLYNQINHLQTSYTITYQYNQPEDFALLVALNKRNFGKHSGFYKPYRQQIFQDLMRIYRPYFITILVNGEKQAVNFGLLWKRTFVGMNSGTNKLIDNLGKLLILQRIQQAIEAGARIYDAGYGDYHWKRYWGLITRPQYKMILP